MRLSVRQQLSLLLILSGCIGLAVLAIATWVTNHDFVIHVSSSRLQITASLKAAQVAFNLEIMQTAASFITTRVIIQNALANYNNASITGPDDWVAAQQDLNATLGDVGAVSNALILQAKVYARNTTGPAGTGSVLNATGVNVESIALPWLNPDGSKAHLGQGGLGYPPALYPNLTIFSTSDAAQGRQNVDSPSYVAEYNGLKLGVSNTLVLGPLLVNETFSLLSLTLPVVNNTSVRDILGWITVVADARLIQLVIQDARGLGKTGQTLLIGPTNTTNLFSPDILGTSRSDTTEVHFLLPLSKAAEIRHANHVVGTANPPFLASAYPAIEAAMFEDARGVNDVGSLMRTHNEENKSVSVGYSVPPTSLVDWIVVVEQARSEVWKPINRLRDLILACLFGVAGFLLIISFPIAHWFVLPIRRLRAATEQTIDTPSNSSGQSGTSSENCEKLCDLNSSSCAVEKTGVLGKLTRWRKKYQTAGRPAEDAEERPFRIPGKVKTRKPWIKDEMSDLVKTFNEMSDELLVQYTKLDEKVRERTIELEHSKKAAEAANESKTLFVANVSHELKTPLNGILGMSAVAMEEDDPQKLKTSLGIIYKSGDLLLRTLSDLLTFSTNQVGHQVLKLDEKEFTLRDLETQVLSIFGDQARDREIALRVDFEDTPGDVFGVSGSLRDALLWGDVHRILQVIINLVSNALKFTSAGGSISVMIRCLSDLPPRRGSLALVKSMSNVPNNRRSAMLGSVSSGTANFINPHEAAEIAEKTVAPAGRDLFMEFEVRDTGEGIAEEMQHRIFEPFVQADSGLSRKHSGTGLGLSICSQLASLMRGTIRLRSKEGQGSSFTVKIPLRHLKWSTPKTSQDGSRDGSSRGGSRRTSLALTDSTSLRKRMSSGTTVVVPAAVNDAIKSVSVVTEKDTNMLSSPNSTASKTLSTTPLKQAVKNASKEVKAKREAKSEFSHIRVLVAEDNKVNQEVILRMLKLEQIHDVTIAEDGQIALDLVKTISSPTSPECVQQGTESPYDLIFMDIQMPNVDGLTSTKLIRQHGFKRPIIALTAYAEQSNIDECYSSGMDYFLAKPIRRNALKKVLTEYCTPSPLAENPVPSDVDGANLLPGNEDIIMKNVQDTDEAQPMKGT